MSSSCGRLFDDQLIVVYSQDMSRELGTSLPMGRTCDHLPTAGVSPASYPLHCRSVFLVRHDVIVSNDMTHRMITDGAL